MIDLATERLLRERGYRLEQYQEEVRRILGLEGAWDEFRPFPQSEWIDEVTKKQTRIGYLHWVALRILQTEPDDPQMVEISAELARKTSATGS